jgi:hypothetical protein
MTESVTFTLDKNDKIVATNAGWDRFAKQNGAPELVGPAIRGKSLFSFIVGDVTRMHVRVMLDYVRTLGKPLERSYRCDSDNLKRYMQMRVVPEDGQWLQLEHKVLKVEPLVVPIVFNYQPATDFPLVRCSNCNRLNTGQDWQEPDLAIDLLPQPGNSTYPICYTVCEDCQTHLHRLLKQQPLT